MSSPNQQPDLDETINVTEAHGRLVREVAATAREKRIADAGREPVSVWIIVVSIVVGMIAGGVFLGSGSGLFAYDSTFKPKYIREAPEGGADEGPQAKAALAAYMAKGAKIYSAKCNGCHGADAKGDGSNYPSLAGSAWVIAPETEILSMVILNGLHGPTSSGKVYGAGVMPAQGAGMAAADLAGLMTYLRNNFGNSTGDVVTVEMAAAALEKSAARPKAGESVSAEELTGEHNVALPGEPLDPEAKVNPATLAPMP